MTGPSLYSKINFQGESIPDMKIDSTVNALKQIIDREGINYLSTNSYEVYSELLDKRQVDSKMARLILITLLAGVQEENTQDMTAVSAYIQRKCCLKKSAADDLSEIYCSLFDINHRKEWEEKTEEGFREFCDQEWNYEMDAYSTWEADRVCVDASCHVSVNIAICNPQSIHTFVEPLLTKNPFITAEAISEYFETKLKTDLDNDFNDYVTCDSYYPPVAEDYEDNFEYLITAFCDKYGFELISWDCVGETSDYIPDF